MTTRHRALILALSILLAAGVFVLGLTARAGVALVTLLLPIALLTVGLFVWSGRDGKRERD